MRCYDSFLYQWQYNGADKFDKITTWCNSMFDTNRWSYHNETILFVDEQEYVMFLLRWS